MLTAPKFPKKPKTPLELADDAVVDEINSTRGILKYYAGEMDFYIKECTEQKLFRLYGGVLPLKETVIAEQKKKLFDAIEKWFELV